MKYIKINIIILIYSFTFCLAVNAVEAQKVIILADDSYPPYSYLEEGELKGIYIDVVRESAKLIRSKYNVELVAIPWVRGLQMIKEGKAFALLPPYQHIKKRSYIWPYSISLMAESVVAFCSKDVDLTEYIQQPIQQNLPPLNIGVNTGYLVLDETLQKAKAANKVVIRESKSTEANIMKLYARRIDCYVNDKLSTLWKLSQMSKKGKVNFDQIQESLLVMLQTAHIGYTNNKNHEYSFKKDFVNTMDKALSVFLSSKKYQEIIKQYQ